ncbi:nicolin-1 isoform X3 [Amblyraja radiata]|uniref:nicolin-1 isoform X3 n=1 Tax=Amblyraja radiata TaxID=386614 RepID=UPI0014035126|nr:nicolin-1 isoform X3 [Amblyraja radiata]
MADNCIACLIKSPVALQSGDLKTDSSKPGVFVIEVTFPKERITNIEKITFKNYYTAFLTIRLQQRVSGESDKTVLKWKTCLRNMCLMSNPHTENGSQDYFSISKQQMLFEPNDVMTMRLILRQPSPVWVNFTLEDIKVYEYNINKNGLPDPDVVASSVQQMWVLTEMVQNNSTSARVGRFDVDGSYDVNMLSYI